MKRYFLNLLIAFFFLSNPVISFSQNIEKAIGNWSGIIELPTAKLEMIFKISENEDGTLVSKLDVPAQNARDLPVKETQISGDSLLLNVAMINGKYEGKLISDSTIEGFWKQNGVKLPLALKKTNITVEINRPQTPKAPFPYEVKEVEYINPKSGLKLAGTLTLPENTKSCPAVVLISGSGAQDRDETLFGHKPFLVIADYLTRHGIAVLRVDDRGVGGSEGNIRDATSEDFASDVEAGVNFLKTVNEINPKQIGLIGHSEGGLIAPIVATQSKDIAFIVLLAGPGINGQQILYAQARLLNKAAGATDEQIEQNRKLQENIFSILLNKKDTAQIFTRLQNAYTNGAYSMMNEDQKKAVDAQITSINTKWFKFFLTYDPSPTLAKVKCPVLALDGSKDLQVPADENLEAIENALKKGGNKNFKTMKLEGLNHLFQHCKTGSTAEYTQIEETFSPEVLEIINNWILNFALKN